MIEAGLVTRLNAEVSAVNGRIHPKKLPQNVTYPAITYEVVSDPREHDHDGPNGLVRARYQVTAWSQSYLEMKQITAAVRGALDGFTGTLNNLTVGGIFHAGGRDLFDQYAGADGVHHGPTDYLIAYSEAT